VLFEAQNKLGQVLDPVGAGRSCPQYDGDARAGADMQNVITSLDAIREPDHEVVRFGIFTLRQRRRVHLIIFADDMLAANRLQK
jgi:hypothetical protein